MGKPRLVLPLGRRLSRRRTLLVIVALLLCAVVVSDTASDRRAPDSNRQDPTGLTAGDPVLNPRPMRVVVLVDLSGGLTAEAVEQEKAAAQLVALGMISDDSEVAVVGFGSADAPGQSAVDTVCPLAGVDPAAQNYFLECTGKLRHRGPTEGDGTDYVAALAQARSILGQRGGEDRTKLVFLLTGNRLDVRGSPQYGSPADRTANAELLLVDQVEAARSEEVQIWPVGFGDADRTALEALANGGYQGNCGDRPEWKPRASLAASTAAVRDLLFSVVGAASCAITTGFDDDVPPVSVEELTVEIPEIATDGVIVVLKGDPRVRVTYISPIGETVPGNGSHDGSVFTLSATDGTVETLRITNPRSGAWKVRLAADSEIPPQQVAAAAMWQGVVHTVVEISPAFPQPGDEVVVQVLLQTRDGVVRRPESLHGLTFTAHMSGDNVADQEVVLADDGQGADPKAGDGEYSGRLRVPENAAGVLTFRGEAEGPGVLSDPVVLSTTVGDRPPPVTAVVELDDGVGTDGVLLGRIVVDNSTDEARTLRLRLTNINDGAPAAMISPSVVEVRPGRVEQDFRIEFELSTRDQSVDGVVVLADANDPAIVTAWARIHVVVPRPPTPLVLRFWWLWALAGAVAVLAAAGLARLRYPRPGTSPPRWGVLELSRGEVALGVLSVPADMRRSPWFRIEPDHDRPLRPVFTEGDRSGAYRLMRDRESEWLVRTPEGLVRSLSSDPVPVEDGLSLRFLVLGTPDQDGDLTSSGGVHPSLVRPAESGRGARPAPLPAGTRREEWSAAGWAGQDTGGGETGDSETGSRDTAGPSVSDDRQESRDDPLG